MYSFVLVAYCCFPSFIITCFRETLPNYCYTYVNLYSLFFFLVIHSLQLILIKTSLVGNSKGHCSHHSSSVQLTVPLNLSS